HGEYPLSTGMGGPYPNSNRAISAYPSWQALEAEMGVDLPEDPVNETGGWAGDGALNYVYVSTTTMAGFVGCPGQAYLLTYRLESGDNDSPGVLRCDNGEPRSEGTDAITVGFSPRQ